MKSYTHIAIAFVALVLSHVAVAADPSDEAMKKFDQNLDAATTFAHGQNNGPLIEIEQLVFTLPRDSRVRDAVEQKLIAALQAATTNDAKDFFCRQLRVIATAKSIPCLEQLLTDADASPTAVYALGYLEFPEACQAMHRALGKTTGVTQAGIINALADRQFQEAKPDLLKLLGSADAPVAQAAARAAGQLGGVDAAEALQGVRAAASSELTLTIDNALLQCAAGLAAAGSNDQAATVYESIRSKQKLPQFQRAALRGLVMTRQADAANLLAQAIQQENTALAGDAIAMINMVPGPEATKAFVGLLKSLPPTAQVLLLRALGSRGDTTASGAIAESVRSDDESVRVAALEALGGVGDASSVVTLVEAATAGGEAQRVAQASLLRVRGADVDQRLLALIDRGNEQVRIEAIDALSGRGAATAVQPLLKTALDERPAIRQAAMRALGSLATPSDLGAMLGLVVQSKSSDDRPVLVAAVAKLLPRCEDKDKSVAMILELLTRAPAASQPALLRILGDTGSEKALPALRSYLKDASSDIQDAVVSALSQWPDARALDDLLGIIETANSPARMELALKGYVRLANTSDEPTELFARVLKRVTQASDKKLVLAGLGTEAESPGAIEMALTYLDDKDLGPTAGLAALRIAYRLRDKHKELARQALERVIKEVDHEDVRQRAQDVLNDMDKFEGHLLNWVGVGPFVEKGKDGAAIYEMVFAPEKPDAQDVKWVPVDKGIGSWDIDLEAMFGSFDHCAAYLRTRVWCPQEQDAVLEMGCDDAVKAWMNGELVFNKFTVQAAAPRQHRADVHLKQGWNDLLLKVVDFEGGWVVGCRVRAPNGIAIDGLKVEAK
jgi:HEAT repeat protein